MAQRGIDNLSKEEKSSLSMFSFENGFCQVKEEYSEFPLLEINGAGNLQVISLCQKLVYPKADNVVNLDETPFQPESPIMKRITIGDHLVASPITRRKQKTTTLTLAITASGRLLPLQI